MQQKLGVAYGDKSVSSKECRSCSCRISTMAAQPQEQIRMARPGRVLKVETEPIDDILEFDKPNTRGHIHYIALVTNNEVRRRIRHLIAAEGSTYQEWAERYHMTRSNFSKIMTGASPPTPQLAAILGLVPVKGFRDPKFGIRRRTRARKSHRKHEERFTEAQTEMFGQEEPKK